MNLDDLPVMAWRAEADGRYVDVNAARVAFGGRPRDDELAHGWLAGVHPDDAARVRATFAADPPTLRVAYRLRHADGAYRRVLDTAGRVGAIWVGTTTELDDEPGEQVAELERRLRDRDVLLRELHHRVKNNLQIVASLINIQASRLDPVAQRALDACQSRISTIALVHQRLHHQKADVARVELDVYMRELAENLHAALARPHVELAVGTAAVTLPIDAAIPCGLIVNELVTNALKYAFTTRERGQVYVGAARVEADEVEVVVADDGSGLPADFELASTPSLGFQLVTALVEQLGGTLVHSTTDGGGTRWTLRFAAA